MVKSPSLPMLFAHRGASSYAPENTLVAFELAVLQNADAVEFDVKLSKDGRVVVIHDSTVDRTTDGSGKVSDLCLDELKELDAGKHFDAAFKGERIPTLNDVFEAIGKKIYINVELANYDSPFDQLALRTAEIVKHHGIETDILFSSFNPIVLWKINKLLPQVPIGMLALPGSRGVFARSKFYNYFLNYDALHPELSDTTPKLIKKCHKYRLKVHSYTVNLYQKMIQLFRWNIDGVFTDDIPLAIKARKYAFQGDF